MTWYFAVPAGPAETWKERAREAAAKVRPASATDASRGASDRAAG